MMPGIDGIETFRRLRAGAGREDLRCIIVTAHDDEQMWRTARELGIRTVLLKPVSLSTLHDALNETLAGIGGPAEARAPAATGQEFRALQATRAGAQVLLAEDNVVNQEVATELLRSAGLEVDVVGNGAEAIEKVRARPYDLVLMDVQMPEIDGLQAARAVRMLRNGRTVPIIAMTANAFGEDREVCLAAGMNDHIAKPVDPDLLYATLLRWIPARAGPPAPPLADDRAVAGADRTPLLWAALGGVAGLDTIRGLGLFDGQAELYLRVLRRFASTYRDGMPALAPATAADRRRRQPGRGRPFAARRRRRDRRDRHRGRRGPARGPRSGRCERRRGPGRGAAGRPGRAGRPPRRDPRPRVTPRRPEGLLRQQHLVDDVDHAVRLVDVGDRHLGQPPGVVGHHDRAAALSSRSACRRTRS